MEPVLNIRGELQGSTFTRNELTSLLVASARIERFLQLTNEPIRRKPFTPNLHAVNVTTPAQYFHLLRRQMLRPYRKPLVVFAPKGILRLPAASSSIAEMSEGTSFKPVLSEEVEDPSKVEKVVFLSGKMYYDLIKQRGDRGLEGKITFIRIEVSLSFSSYFDFRRADLKPS